MRVPACRAGGTAGPLAVGCDGNLLELPATLSCDLIMQSSGGARDLFCVTASISLRQAEHRSHNECVLVVQSSSNREKKSL